MVENLQESVRLRLGSAGLRSPDRPAWARSGWKVFQDHPDDISRTIRYIRENPLKGGMSPPQRTFVAEYDKPQAADRWDPKDRHGNRHHMPMTTSSFITKNRLSDSSAIQ